MAYRLKLKESLPLEVRRIALEQLEIARAALSRQDDRATAVHDARRALKRLRAMLRLVRPALGEANFKQSNRQLAGLGQRLSRSRDLDVMLATLSKLENGSGHLPKLLAARLRRSVDRSRTKHNGAAGDDGSERGLGSALRRAERLFSADRLRGVDIQQIADGLQQSYRRARSAFREAYTAESDEAFHNWRKATQAHWRHMQLIGRGWPESLGARAGEAKELSRLLGEDHDLSVLLTFAESPGSSELSAEDLAALRAACLSCQRQIRDLARPHGQRLFAERPRQLSKRILRYWRAAEQLSTLLPAEREPQPSELRPSLSQQGLAGAAAVSAHAAAGKRTSPARKRKRPPASTG
jgi:CHAD domain-containing protein